jgi:hypothetical protein
MEFFAEYGLEIVCALVTAGALAICRVFNKKLKEYKSIVDAQEEAKLETFIEKRLEPIYQELEDLRKYCRDNENMEKSHMNLIVASYRFRLIQLCKGFLHQGYITEGQLEQLIEFYKLYKGLGGNGQAEAFYNKAVALPLKTENDPLV